MNTNTVPYDCSLLLRGWQEDPSQTISENLLTLLDLYSKTYRRLVLEIRKLEGVCNPPCQQEETEALQFFVDSSISYLDPNEQ
jgi:hypothetical protein